MTNIDDFHTIALIVGIGLIVFPDPATTGMGLLITAAAFGLEGRAT